MTIFEKYPRLQEFLDKFYPGIVVIDADIMVQYGDWLLVEESKERNKK